jgi:hypothetical protein
MPSFTNGFMYPFEQKSWIKEILLAIGIAAIPIVGYFMIRGWEYEISVRVRHKSDDLFPGWGKPIHRFRRGFAIRFAGFVYHIPTFILAGITLWLWLGPILEALGGQISLNADLGTLYRPALPLRISMIIITIIVHFFMNTLFWSGYLRYVDTRRYALMFDIGTNMVVALRTMWDDLFLELYMFFAEMAAGMIAGVVGVALTATGVGAFLVPILSPAAHFAFLSMVSAYWFGEMAEHSYGDHEHHEPQFTPEQIRLRRLAREQRLNRVARRRYNSDTHTHDSY